MSEFLTMFRRFKDFSGRSRRREYWISTLIFQLILIGLSRLEMVLDLNFGVPEVEEGPLVLLYNVILFIPVLALNIRRLHDVGRSGWWLFMSLVPLVGWLVLLNFFVREGEARSNKWGPNPKAMTPVQGGAWG
ncbi:DUF805 domain-containing protein [Deinococcus oregonensis]|uniref:DUF805 domain-containing protein n=1 Tax=Deinococcus oregonensis TaxID=1805970 RepID=A0ABV6B603_9DEIO